MRKNGASLWDASAQTNVKINCLIFTDDSALLVDSIEEVLEFAREFCYILKKRKLKLNISEGQDYKNT